jgi:hypothetical protein
LEGLVSMLENLVQALDKTALFSGNIKIKGMYNLKAEGKF